MTYALSNPLSELLQKFREEFSRDDLVKVIEEKRIEKLTFHYTALDGKLKELKIPVVSRLQAERALADGERVDGSSLFKGMVDAALSDLYVVPLYKTAFINPFDETSLDFICRYFTRDGSLASFAPDSILHNASRLFQKNTGLELRALGELEFYLLSHRTPLYVQDEQRGYHASSPFMKGGPILDEMVRLLSIITGAVKYVHGEVGYVERVESDHEEINGKQGEQLEIEFLPVAIENAGDFLVLARWLIRNVAFRHGCIATFAPKLEEGIAGNGLHVHLELARNGRNIMTASDGKLSTEARKLIGGLCRYADSLTGFGNTVSSAYLRLVPNQEAPTRICWSDFNRSALIRVPLGWAKAGTLADALNAPLSPALQERDGRQTIELRSPDGSAIVHLLLAGITMAAEWGLTHDESLELATRLYTSGNVFREEKLFNGFDSLPRTCAESSRILLQKRLCYERSGIFPPSVIDYVAGLLQLEGDEDMNALLSLLPEQERLREMRKIMHRDIHRH